MDCRLVMFRDSGERRDFPLQGGITVIGRGQDCQIRIPLAEISRQHASVTVIDAKIYAKDMGSANGTYVNNNRLAEMELSPGDHLIIGPVVFTVQVDGKPSEIRPVKTKLRKQNPVESLPDDEHDFEEDLFGLDEADDDDPISALEDLAASADQTAIDFFEDEEG